MNRYPPRMRGFEPRLACKALISMHTYKAKELRPLARYFMPTSKKKTEKIEGVKKHNELVRAKKQATKERKAVALPAGYKKKK